MRGLRRGLASVALAGGLLAALLTGTAVAQTAAATGEVVGTITDPSGAVIPGATVTLINTGTNARRTANTNGKGGYTFPAVAPGIYSMTVAAKGFQTSAIAALQVSVAQSSLANVKMKLGSASQTVEVTAGGAAQLQTTNATIGNTVGSQALIRLPTLQHDASELLNLQPGTATNGSNETRVAGANDDQNTISVDGIDVTGGVIAGAGSNTTMVPIPVDSVQEFRVGVTNNGASMDTGSGGQVTLTGRTGTNQIHGAVYAYYQNNKMNANSWNDNHTPSPGPNGTKLPFTPRPPLQDKRFGARIGGPIQHNKTFYFADYEGRRFAQVFDTTSLVPSPALLQGILRFPDASGNIISYPLATSTACGAGGNQACDPRGLGESPTVAAMNKLFPAGNNPAQGDGLNLIGYDSTVKAPLTSDYWVGRLDHSFNSKWAFQGSYVYSREIFDAAGNSAVSPQYSIVGGNVTPIKPAPQRGTLISGSLTGTITPNLLNTFRFGWVRNDTLGAGMTPTQIAQQEKLPGTDTSAGWIAYQPQSSYLGFRNPIDDSTGNARFQATNVKKVQYLDDVNWMKGSHTIQAGFHIDHLPTVHTRSDKVVGSITSLAALTDTASFLRIPAADEPQRCSASVSSNCLPSSFAGAWNALYASTLGLIDNVGVLGVRNAALQPLPFGTNLTSHSTMDSYDFYVQDVWRLSPSLTATYGLAYGWQTPPVDSKDLQTLLIDNSTGKALGAREYMDNKLAAAQTGEFYNPELAYLPIAQAGGRKVVSTDWGNWAPRIGIAWNPDITNGFLGTLFGGKKTVLRGGFGVVYDRSNMVQEVEIPMLGVGFADTVTVPTPACNTTGTGGTGCNSASTNPALADFRIGVDGTLPVPVLKPSASPVVPAAPYAELLSFQLDPNNKIGKGYNADISVQRQLPAGMMLQLGWVGHYGRLLPEAINFNNSPYMFKDKASGQTFAQAYDAVANSLRSGSTPGEQPFFNNMLPGMKSGSAPISGTDFLAASDPGDFIRGNVSNLFNLIDGARARQGLPSFDNRQVLVLFMRTHQGYSNYNGMIVTLRKETQNGLSLGINYTWAHALDDGVSNQDSAGFFPNSYYPTINYGASRFDVRQSLNATTVWNLPLGTGHAISFQGRRANGFINNWYVSAIVTAQAGFPVEVSQGSQVYGGGAILSGTTYAVPTVGVSSLGAGLHSGVGGGTGLNLFADPQAAIKDFAPVQLAAGGVSGTANPMTGLPFVNLDMSIGKTTQITEGTALALSVDFFNALNNVNFETPGLSLFSPRNFGAITNQFVPANRTAGSRWIELGARFTF
ncbi:MAG: carboxypeptidase regulatory-like domain-containing protein [Acidobacteria bacterium]|nr:MAG: carboxypeptidase regulatory-like domain-containing protein [Acidobacteriota bacterium]